ncbi:hypothetical protein HMI49_03985 [Corallococcus exercitus]|uniref:Lipoprotein n=1 Tax=Corallococcus exercitus TaxID=2316736 RepID=A0A7Y4NPC3_9BACT|nr:hypothetical protein [Corallococcus exercitus]NOK32360.1 hypothetical protein [Corallococcus exercitus]
MSPSRLLLVPLLLAQLLLGSACRPWLHVKLASAQERLPAPAFSVEDPSQDGGPPLYDTIHVLAEDGEVVWFARAQSFGGAHPSRIIYGEVPPSFESVEGPQRLESGRLYRIEVSGTAAGTLRFLTGPDGRVYPEKD